MKVGANSASVLRELSITINNMTKSKKLDSLVKEMNIATQELQNLLKSYSNTHKHNVNAKETSSLGDAKMEIPIMEVIQVVTVVSLLTETVARVEDVVKSVEELSKLAKFKPEMSKCDKSKQRSTQNKILPDQHDEEATIKTLQIV